MNASIVITRYAKALVKYVNESGNGAAVCSEAETLVKALHGMEDLSRMVKASDDVVSRSDKERLLKTALGAEMSPELGRFLSLLSRNGRMDMAEEILRDFVDMYHRGNGLRKVQLTLAVKPTPDILQRVSALVKERTGADAIVEVTVDPGIIGGFVLDFDDTLMDASVRRSLERIREQFVEQNRRII